MATTLRCELPGSVTVGLPVGRRPIMSGVASVMPTPDPARAIETAVSVTVCWTLGSMPPLAQAKRHALPK